MHATCSMEWRIYDPSAYLVTIQSGDVAYVRPESSMPGFQGICCCQADKDNDDRYVQLKVKTSTDDTCELPETTRRVKRKRLLPVYQAVASSTSTNPSTDTPFTTAKQQQALILVTPQTLHYRHLAASQTNHTDHVLELGCSTGMTSAILWKMQPKSWVALDTGADMVATTRQKMNQQTITSNSRRCCQQMDALQESDRAVHVANQFGSISLVFIDIGGNRTLPDVISMLDWVMTCLNSPSLRMVVVKSQELAAALRDKADREGLVRNGAVWFQQQQQGTTRNSLPSHPLQAPIKTSPLDDNVYICRYHNYHVSGCLKAEECPHDHVHCHLCREAGHIAKLCPKLTLK